MLKLPAEAAQTYSKALQMLPRNQTNFKQAQSEKAVETKLLRARAFLAAKCYSDALTDLQEVLTQESWNYQAHFLIAKCLAAGAENSQS